LPYFTAVNAIPALFFKLLTSPGFYPEQVITLIATICRGKRETIIPLAVNAALSPEPRPGKSGYHQPAAGITAFLPADRKQET
jgi:hypothetical protein